MSRNIIKFFHKVSAVVLSTSLYGCSVVGSKSGMHSENEDIPKVDEVNYSELGRLLTNASVNLKNIEGKILF